MRAKEFTKEEPKIRFADGYLKFSDHFEDRLLDHNIDKREVLQMLHKLEVMRSIDLIKMPFVPFVVRSPNLSLAVYKQLDKSRNTAYVIATAHRTLKVGDDEDVIYLEEDQSLTGDEVLQYVKRAHAPDEFDIDSAITDHPSWELKNIPISQLKLDPDGEVADPYGRVNWVDYDKVQDLMPKIGAVLKRMPVVVDSQGWIIDGNHRATAAAEAGLTSVPAYVPTEINENFADGKVQGKSRPGRVKRAGASCDGSVTDLRAKARKYGGEKGKMYHWCANMKGGKKKANEEYYDGHNFYGAQIGEAPINKNMRAKDFTNKDELDYTDPELARTLAYAGVHYPNYKKRPEAFMKWASRAILHSEEQDNLHNSQFAELHHELDQLKQLVSKISQRSQ